MPDPLILSEGELRQHVAGVSAALSSVFNSRASFILDLDNWGVDSLVTAILVGDGCERVPRDRGKDVFVAPLRAIDEDLWAWLGLHEEWMLDASSTKQSKPLMFRSLGMTVHFGQPNVVWKPQIFRAEWSGWSVWNGTDPGFQAGAAGHPHWQFDALETVVQPEQELERRQRLGQLGRDEPEARDFQESPDGLQHTARRLILSRKLSRLHFPSAAGWWRAAPDNAHAHSPANAQEIEIWMRKTLCYVIGELDRL